MVKKNIKEELEPFMENIKGLFHDEGLVDSNIRITGSPRCGKTLMKYAFIKDNLDKSQIVLLHRFDIKKAQSLFNNHEDKVSFHKYDIGFDSLLNKNRFKTLFIEVDFNYIINKEEVYIQKIIQSIIKANHPEKKLVYIDEGERSGFLNLCQFEFRQSRKNNINYIYSNQMYDLGTCRNDNFQKEIIFKNNLDNYKDLKVGEFVLKDNIKNTKKVYNFFNWQIIRKMRDF